MLDQTILLSLCYEKLAVKIVVCRFVAFKNVLQFSLQDSIRTAEADNKSCSPGHLLEKDSICFNELSSFNMKCSVSTSDRVLVSISNGLLLEEYLRLLFYYSSRTLNISSKCQLLFRHLQCLLGYGVCDGNRILQFSRESCEAIRDSLCVKEWLEFSQFSGPSTFLDCNTLQPSLDEYEGTITIGHVNFYVYYV